MAMPSVDQIGPFLERLTPGLLYASVGSLLALGIAGVTVLAMRRSSGSARYQAWLLGFAGALVLPVLSAVLPGWRLLPRTGARGEAHTPLLVVRDLAPGVPTVPSVPPPNHSYSGKKDANLADASNDSSGPARQRELARSSVAAPKSGPTVPPGPVPPPVRTRWTVWVILCWAGGSVLVLCRIVLGHVSLCRLERRSTKVSGSEWVGLLVRLREELRIVRPVTLLSSPARTVPMTWGIWRARLLLPGQAVNWPAAQLRDVLLHELGHVSRWDCLTQCVAQVACALYWFNPLAWVASRRMQVERERACDDLVLSRGTQAAIYARHLLQTVCPVPWSGLVGPAVAMATASTLEERMRAILDPRVNRRALTARGTLGVVLLLTMALLPMAALKAQQAPPAPRDPSQADRIRGGGTAPGPATRTAGRVGRGGFGGLGGAAEMPAPTLGQGPTSTFDATIYDVRVPPDQIGRIDVDALSKASATIDGFEQALAALGSVKPMYRAHQSVRLVGDTVMISSQVPIETSKTMTATGQMLSNYSYHNVGARFALAGKTDGVPQLDLNIQLSSASDSPVAISDKVKVPVIRTATLLHKGAFQPQKPFVVVSVDADSPDKDGKAVAYIARVIVGDPESGGKP